MLKTNENQGGIGVMDTIKGFWQHTNGKIYAVESDTFGKVIGGVGPLDPDDLHDLNDYDYKPAIIGWVADAVAQHKLHRINPSPCR
jgi:hypothetical protein